MDRQHTESPLGSSDDDYKLDHRYSSDDSTSDPGDGLLKEARGLEAQQTPSDALENRVPLRSKAFFLAVYFLLNLSLTISNKSVLSRVSHATRSPHVNDENNPPANPPQLSLPWLLTTLQTGATALGCTAMLLTGRIKLTKLSTRENLILIAFSTLFTLNIAISNVSLSLVSVPFHQIARSTCPVVTILIYRLLFARSYPPTTYLSLIPLVLGVAIATAGDYSATLLGTVLTFLGVLLACVKTIATNRIMTGPLALSPAEFLLRMSPLAALQCTLYALLRGEVGVLLASGTTTAFAWPLVAAVAANAAMAFALNIVSFQTNKMVGALTVTVCGNVKQALTILVGIVFFAVPVGLWNGVGMAITLVGAAWYSKLELDGKRTRG